METAAGVLVSVLLMAFGLALLVEVHGIHRLRRHGVTTTAQVVGHRRLTDKGGEPRYHIEVVLTLPDGTEIRAGSAGSLPGEPPLLRPDTTGVVHDPRRPTRVSVSGADEGHHRFGDALAYLVTAGADPGRCPHPGDRRLRPLSAGRPGLRAAHV
ncbi:DUF3592 domain-containing protein [Streptomyces sp. NPDC059894]|uniref:DUF3592 domain-containing protein n=1 Tax=unclassified Streptomyces TaxID=2593676 RepID=UPI00364B7467